MLTSMALQGSPEAWYLATKQDRCVVHSLGLKDLPFDLSSSSWGLPPNMILETWSECPQLPYVDNIFDVVIVAHHLFGGMKCTLWPTFLRELSRVLVPGGVLIISAMDALPRGGGPLLESWVDKNIVLNVLRTFMVPQPSLLLPSWVEEDGHFDQKVIDRVEFACEPALGRHNQVKRTGETRDSPKRRQSYSTGRSIQMLDSIDEESLAAEWALDTRYTVHDVSSSRAGWNYYERLYGPFVSKLEGPKDPETGLTKDWWCTNNEIRREGEHFGPRFELTTFVYQCSKA